MHCNSMALTINMKHLHENNERTSIVQHKLQATKRKNDTKVGGGEEISLK